MKVKFTKILADSLDCNRWTIQCESCGLVFVGLPMPKFLELYGWRFFAVMFDLLNEPFHIHVTEPYLLLCERD